MQATEYDAFSVTVHLQLCVSVLQMPYVYFGSFLLKVLSPLKIFPPRLFPFAYNLLFILML
jgi:hypothetical protein